MADMAGNEMTLGAWAGAEARLPLRAPVRVAGKPGHICGRSFAHERYDVIFLDHSIIPGLPRDLLEINWEELSK